MGIFEKILRTFEKTEVEDYSGNIIIVKQNIDKIPKLPKKITKNLK